MTVIWGGDFNTEEDENDKESRELYICTKVLGLKKAENEDQGQKEVYTFKAKNHRFKSRIRKVLYTQYKGQLQNPTCRNG